MDSVALLATPTPAAPDMAAAIRSLPEFEVIGQHGDYSLLQMSQDWYGLIGPDVLDDDGAEAWACATVNSLIGWYEAHTESFGILGLKHFHRL